MDFAQSIFLSCGGSFSAGWSCEAMSLAKLVSLTQFYPERLKQNLYLVRTSTERLFCQNCAALRDG